MTNLTDKNIKVTALGFRKSLETYPKRIELAGRTYDFVDAGLRCQIKNGGNMTEILTMSDGESQFKLRSDNLGQNWTLLSVN